MKIYELKAFPIFAFPGGEGGRKAAGRGETGSPNVDVLTTCPRSREGNSEKMFTRLIYINSHKGADAFAENHIFLAPCGRQPAGLDCQTAYSVPRAYEAVPYVWLQPSLPLPGGEKRPCYGRCYWRRSNHEPQIRKENLT